MRFYSALSDLAATQDAIDDILSQLRGHSGNVDAAWLFFTPDHRHAMHDAVSRISASLRPRVMVGCSAEGVIGGDREVERLPGISLLIGQMPAVRVHPVRIAVDDWKRLLTGGDDFRDHLGLTDDTRAIIGFGDPWTTPINQFMQALDMLAPRSPLIGGLASGAQAEGENLLVLNDEIFDDGFVGVSLSGPIRVDTLVSQGARPVGEPMIVTKGHENFIDQLGGRPALTVASEMIGRLSEEDRALLQRGGLMVGRVMSEYREQFGRGDFLVRNVMGAKEASLAISDLVRVGQTVQFHLRDAATADEDLRLMLADAAQAGIPAAALLFSCNGRGTRMFDQPSHDAAVAGELLQHAPLAGFFAAGELGPVGSRNFVHGHTASFALLREV